MISRTATHWTQRISYLFELPCNGHTCDSSDSASQKVRDKIYPSKMIWLVLFLFFCFLFFCFFVCLFLFCVFFFELPCVGDSIAYTSSIKTHSHQHTTVSQKARDKIFIQRSVDCFFSFFVFVFELPCNGHSRRHAATEPTARRARPCWSVRARAWCTAAAPPPFLQRSCLCKRAKSMWDKNDGNVSQKKGNELLNLGK